MICMRCKKNEAAYHITKIIDNKKQELNLCQKCAKDLGVVNSPFAFQNIISEIMEYIDQPGEVEIPYELACSNCGTTYSEFKKKGYLGCSECYTSFAAEIAPVIKRAQGNMKHIGKIPKRKSGNVINRNEINYLKSMLQRAVENEEYEKAAELRDKIKKINSVT